MTYGFARVEAVLKMRAEDVFIQEPRTWAPLHEKGVKHHEMPCHHKLETCLQDYAAALGDAGIETKIGSHSFRASETDPEPGFMARWLMLCTLPRSNPGSREKYVRRNGPYTLVMTAGHPHRRPFGNIPRLLAAWVCTDWRLSKATPGRSSSSGSSALAQQVRTEQGWELTQVRFYAGIPDAPGWHFFWTHKLAAIGRQVSSRIAGHSGTGTARRLCPMACNTVF